eukprot:snap_masked-scaffold_7-processed-gene-10.56-mRNA-1 protein AED:1.00 eAED:1.00 QI:0/-1/0/0/-1/1/1/0/100
MKGHFTKTWCYIGLDCKNPPTNCCYWLWNVPETPSLGFTLRRKHKGQKIVSIAKLLIFVMRIKSNFACSNLTSNDFSTKKFSPRYEEHSFCYAVNSHGEQ